MKEGHCSYLDLVHLSLRLLISTFQHILPKNTSRLFSEISKGVNREQQKMGVIIGPYGNFLLRGAPAPGAIYKCRSKYLVLVISVRVGRLLGTTVLPSAWRFHTTFAFPFEVFWCWVGSLPGSKSYFRDVPQRRVVWCVVFLCARSRRRRTEEGDYDLD